MKINKLILHNFRSCDDVEYTFSDINIIRGKMGSGKSTIAEGIEWILLGTNCGVQRSDDRLIREGSSDMMGELHVTKDDGQVYVINRTRKQSQTVTLNGRKVSQERLFELFANINTFLSIFIPGFFSELEPKDARATLAWLLPFIPHQQVISEMEKLKPDDAELLSHEKFAAFLESCEHYLSLKREEHKEESTEVQRLEGEIRALNDLLKNKPEKPTQPISPEVQQKYEEAKIEIIRLEQQLTQSQLNVSLRASLQAKKEAKLKEHSMLKDQLKAEPKLICTTCEQPLTEEKAQSILIDVRTHNVETVQKIIKVIAESKDLANQISEIPEIITSAVEDRLNDLRKKVAACEEILKQYDKEQSNFEGLNEAYQTANGRLLTAEKDLEKQQHIVGRLDAEIKAAVNYRVTYTELQINELNKRFDLVKIKLFDASRETGEVRPAYKVTWNGRSYRVLSNGEKVHCDLEIGRVIAAALNETFPVYVDNAEGVENLFDSKFCGQVFAAFMIPGQPLTIEPTPAASQSMLSSEEVRAGGTAVAV